MKLNKTTGFFMLLLTAILWGVAFVAQTDALENIGSFTFNACRMGIGGVVLMPLLAVFYGKSDNKAEFFGEKKTLFWGGLVCGAFLAIASSFQNWGLAMDTGTGKAGFITTLYVVIVPLLSFVFLRKKIPLVILPCIALAVCGLYLLCMKEQGSFSMTKGEIMVLICAFLFSGHILVIDYYSPKVNTVALSCLQFFFASIISVIFAFIFERDGFSFANLRAAIIPILYTGIMSCGVAYTLQVVAQKVTDPTVASITMSLESVFSALAGWLLLNQALSLREIFGCALVFAAVILSEIPIKPRKKCE